MKNKNVNIRIFKDLFFKSIVILLSLFSTVPLFLILFYIVRNGIASINWEFLINLPKPVGEPGGGIANALVGTIILIVLASLVSIPLGVIAGIYLSEFGHRKIAYWVRLAVEVLLGVPSIVVGILVYVWLVQPTGAFSAVSGGVALGIMMLPIIIKSTEETLNLVPFSIKEASLALGVPYYKTIIKVVLPAGISGILTGIIISISRIAGETAPLLFTAFGNPFMNLNIFKPVSSLPLIIFNYSISPYPEWHALAWGASFILVVLVLVLNLCAKGVARKWKIQY